MLAPEPRFWYRPLSVLEPFERTFVHGIELADVASHCGASFVLGQLAAVDADERFARTVAGSEFGFDALVMAIGARPVAAVEGALTFRGLADTDAFRAVLADLERGAVRRLVFASPGGRSWPLPLYELALQTAAFLLDRTVRGVSLALVTPEPAPLSLFGAEASAAVSELLDRAAIEFKGQSYPVSYADGALTLSPFETVPADRVVALPQLDGPKIEGLPCDHAGFIPVDGHGRVRGVDGVYAAGDATTFPIKQGGIAAQQADAAAEAIAAKAGASVRPRPFDPVLRGLLLTGGQPRFLRAAVGRERDSGAADVGALWWPPGKIVGRFLSPFLAERAGVVLTQPPPAGLPVEVEANTDPVLQ